MELTETILKELLVEPGHIAEKDFTEASEEARRQHVRLEQFLIEKGLISDEQIGKTIADHFDYRFVDLRHTEVGDECLALIPPYVAETQRAIAFSMGDTAIKLATEHMENYEFIKLLEKKAGKPIELYYATPATIDIALRNYKGDLRKKIDELILSSMQEQAEGDIVSLVNLFLEYANDSQASDIHLEPLENDVVVRFRIDGLLHEMSRYPKALHDKVTFRIKIMAHLQTDEHAAAQDGRFDFASSGMTFDVRVSILPITGGENIVMRLLDSHTHKYTLENLGLADADYQKVLRAIEKPHGMILAVGPTGSGKTTILYTVLEKLNTPEVNISTIEDPVEYDIEGVQQTQVNPKKNITFAKGLRSIVRQDPDIIMVGEIRDEETADIAVNAALTGHILLSTLHTNDAVTTFPRLIEMNVEPFLIASSVNVIIALRLVRKICEACKKSHIINDHERALLKTHPEILDHLEHIVGGKDIAHIRFYAGSGCKICNKSGFSGRVGIFEILEMHEDIRMLIMRKASANIINQKAHALGMTSLLHDGVAKAVSGTTTLEEVIRAAKT